MSIISFFIYSFIYFFTLCFLRILFLIESLSILFLIGSRSILRSYSYHRIVLFFPLSLYFPLPSSLYAIVPLPLLIPPPHG